MTIKKGNKVKVLVGKDKNKEGEIIEIDRSKYRAKVKTLKQARNITKAPIVAIGGINSSNYKKLLLNKANFLAISGYIWKNKKMKPIEAINKII